ncbi:GntR family transcriptional regulator [Alicyclobacillus mengziensis]|uniref:GntR family transcriptional regulator n=1 Tax=Alicyclobacillus mengziensis TaxID=2931921 RepID=A0A9X7W0K4_9BACL|nr:GntR family transcriptional regulator [Alicyclobacillus mengziensis]QSO48247.1 GntR family transcriptional regulator [Alicyclobacillus mengziensis]
MELQRPLPLYIQVYQVLRQKILEGQFTPGETMLESRIAEQLGVSRTPVREALRQLVSERLVVSSGSELTVINPDLSAIRELYTCRGALEAIVAVRASELADESDIVQMSEALCEAEAAIQSEQHVQVFSANTRFHDSMVTSARMPLLSELLETIRGPILIARRHILSRSAEVETAIIAEHRKILEAIEQHNPELAKQRMEEHMRNDMSRAALTNGETASGT